MWPDTDLRWLPTWLPHRCRTAMPGWKTCGTLLAALDVHPQVARQLLRHSRISVTMEINIEATRAALKRLVANSLSTTTRPMATKPGLGKHGR